MAILAEEPSKRYRCGLCGKSYATHQALGGHAVWYRCGVCGAEFPTGPQLGGHIWKHYRPSTVSERGKCCRPANKKDYIEKALRNMTITGKTITGFNENPQNSIKDPRRSQASSLFNPKTLGSDIPEDPESEANKKSKF